ncbi:MAG TPA: TonB-dependent receptor [Pseudomonadales bacterium]|nr:TonB-dependent receptor [Pseudomonadales bacterium]
MSCYLKGKTLPECIAYCLVFLVGLTATSMASAADAKKPNRKIEEVVVTAEKVQSTVSDTSISITAFNSQMISDFGLQNANDMVNYIPATTRDAYDIRIRGVGRNFRALGGDPGVATYYNGVFSPDFGIAASENALWDLARVEVLRGPQGTLYGRNAIGGAINYVTNDPTFDWTGKVKLQFGDRNDREAYGVISGPIIKDKVAFRLLGIRRLKDGNIHGLGGTQDTDSTGDRNDSLALTWDVTDNITFKTRANDRLSNRVIQSPVLMNEGPTPIRHQPSTGVYVFGLHPVASTDPGAMAFTDPADGSTVYGAYVRPGVDVASTYAPNAAYGNSVYPQMLAGSSRSDPNNTNISNNDGGGPCKFPYTTRNCNNEKFAHQSNQTDINWQLSDNVTLKYIFGYTDYKYDFNIDEDFSTAQFSKSRVTVREDVQQKSHELQLFWSIGDKWTATSGAFWYDEIRMQDYSITNTTPRYTAPTDYGTLAVGSPYLGGASLMQILELYTPGGILPSHVRLGDAPLGNRTALGLWDGDPRGDQYHHLNTVHNLSQAYYTQGTYKFNEHWDLVLGVRYAKDKKTGTEIRTGYSEYPTSAVSGAFGLDPVLAALDGGIPVGATTGLTTLGALNIAMGNATYSGNPADPLTPTCSLTSASCTHVLRMEGIPISFSGHIMSEDQWSDVNYRVNLDWTPNDNTLMYFSVTTGYRPGGYALGIAGESSKDANGKDVPGEYSKETVSSLEVGYKGQLIDNTLQLDLSAYHYDYKNYQDEVQTYDSLTSSTSDLVQNAPKATNEGFEAEVLWLATDELTVGGNYSYTRTKYNSDYYTTVFNQPELPVSLFAPGGAATRPDLYVVNMKGNDLKKIPRQKATIWSSYRWGTSVGDVTFHGTYSYTGSYWDQGYQNSVDQTPSRYRVDVSASWEDPAHRWEVRAFVNNVTDVHAVREMSEGTESSNWRLSGTILETRFFGLSASYNFTP